MFGYLEWPRSTQWDAPPCKQCGEPLNVFHDHLVCETEDWAEKRRAEARARYEKLWRIILGEQP